MQVINYKDGTIDFIANSDNRDIVCVLGGALSWRDNFGGEVFIITKYMSYFVNEHNEDTIIHDILNKELLIELDGCIDYVYNDRRLSLDIIEKDGVLYDSDRVRHLEMLDKDIIKRSPCGRFCNYNYYYRNMDTFLNRIADCCYKYEKRVGIFNNETATMSGLKIKKELLACRGWTSSKYGLILQGKINGNFFKFKLFELKIKDYYNEAGYHRGILIAAHDVRKLCYIFKQFCQKFKYGELKMFVSY